MEGLGVVTSEREHLGLEFERRRSIASVGERNFMLASVTFFSSEVAVGTVAVCGDG